MMKAWVVAVAAATMGALSLVASTETDWSGKSGAVTIPAGETWVADEGDMAQVNALAKITLEGEGTLIFRNTTTVPKEGLLAGAGVVRKAGSSDWTLENAQSGFTGDFHLDGGVITVNAPATFGKYDDNSLGENVGGVYVWDGASLVLNKGTVDFRWRKVHIAGKGNVASPYALKVVSCRNSGVGYLQLEADASLYSNQYYWMSNQGTTVYQPGGIINLQSYTLTKYGSSIPMSFLGLKMIGSGRLVLQEGWFYYREWASLGDPDAELGPVVFPDRGTSWIKFNFYNRPTPVYRPFVINGNVYIDYSRNDSTGHRNLASTNYNHIIGNVTVAEGKILRLHGGFNDNNQISISGDISGAGAVHVGEYGYLDYASRGIGYLSGHNTYTGGTHVNGYGRQGLIAAYPDSLPDFAATHVHRGYMAAVMGLEAKGDRQPWTKDDLWRFANTADLDENGHLSIDARECPDGVCELTAEEINANITNPDNRAIGCAGGVLRIRNDSNETPQRVKLATDRGRVELVGGGTFTVADMNDIKGAVILSTGPTGTNPEEDATPIPEVRVMDGSTVVQGDDFVFVGGYRTPSSNGVYDDQGMARLVITNASWVTTSTAAFNSRTTEGEWGDGEKQLGTGAIWVGHRNRGILEIQDGAFVSNRVVVGGGSKFSSGTGIGAIHLKGGELQIVRGGESYLTSSIGAAGYGGLIQTGGKLVSPKTDLVIGNYYQGVAHVYGGEADIQRNLELSCMNGGRSILYMTNGTWNVNGYTRMCSGDPGQSFLTLDGPQAQLLLNESVYGAGRAGDTTCVNLNHGGLLQMSGFVQYRTRDEFLAANNPNGALLNFNGGILRSTTWPNALFGRSEEKRLAHVTIFEEGAVLDIPVNTATQIAATPLEAAPVEGGIQAVTLPEEYKGMVGAPWVVVENINGGTGVGASAVADWDCEHGVVKGIIVTSHGWGYEEGKVQVVLKWADFNIKTIRTVTVGPNRTGGLTKCGAGTLELRAVNGWQKWTAIEGGVIKPTVAGAIPSGTELRLSGGTLDLNNLGSDAPTFAGLVGTGGTVKNGAAKIVGNWQVSAQKFLDRETTALAGTLDLTACTGITITDGHLLDSDAARALKRLPLFTATTVIWPKNLDISGDLPKWWVARKADNKVSLGYNKPLVLFIR